MFINSPYYHIGIYSCKDVEIHHVNVTVDRHIQRKIKQKKHKNRKLSVSQYFFLSMWAILDHFVLQYIYHQNFKFTQTVFFWMKK